MLITAFVFTREEAPLYLSLLPLGIPFAQVTIFSLYHTNRTKQKFGLAFGSAMVVSLVLLLLRMPADSFSVFIPIFLVTSFMSAILHAFYGYGSESALTVDTK
jgi:hypothetical protein